MRLCSNKKSHNVSENFVVKWQKKTTRAHPAISHCSHLLLKITSGYKYKSLAKSTPVTPSSVSHPSVRPQFYSSTDKQRICVNTQLKSSKKQLKLYACLPISNFFERYAITLDVNVYHLVHFFSIWAINKCQSGIFFLQACAQ